MNNKKYKKLIKSAIKAKKYAYAPYSNFVVGAAVQTTEGFIFSGCNIENAAFSPSLCAERTAFAKAISEGYQEFEALAVCGDKNDYLTPCGVCRQVIAEFCNPDTFVILLVNSEEDYKELFFKDLFPGAFGKENLTK